MNKNIEFSFNSTEPEKTEKYEKPSLEIVKFMFENDITWGSFDSTHGGDNEADVSEDWWD